MLSVESDVQLQAACEKIQAIAKGMRLDEKMRFGGMAFSPNGNTFLALTITTSWSAAGPMARTYSSPFQTRD